MLSNLLTTIRDELTETITCPIAPGWINQNQALPFITYNVTGSKHEYTLDKASGFASYEVTFDIWSNTYSEAIELSESIQSVLSGNEVEGYYCQLANSVDLTEPPNAGEETPTYHLVREYNFWTGQD